MNCRIVSKCFRLSPRLFLSALVVASMLSARAYAQNDDSVLVIGSDGSVTGILLDDVDSPRGTALDQANDLFFVSVTGGLGSSSGAVVQVDLSTGVATPFVTGVAPFDLEIDPASGDLFISDALSGSILRTPTDVSNPTTFVSGFVPSGLGFAPNGSLFAGAQPSSPDGAGLFEVTFNPDGTGTGTQVGNLIQPFDVQVDSLGNVFVNNGIDFPTDGEVAVFPELGAIGSVQPTTPLDSLTFSDTAIRGLAIAPDDSVFATTADLTIVEFDPLVDISTVDPTANLGTVFAGPPISDIGNPFAFDIQFLNGGDFQILLSSDSVVPEPTSALLATLACMLEFTTRRRR